MELEYKFLAEGSAPLQPVLCAAHTLGWSVGEPSRCDISDEYWDDEERTAEKAGLFMRLRSCEGKTLYTEKRGVSQEDGRFAREETEVELTEGTLPEALCVPGRVPVLRVDHQRDRYELTRGRTEVELAWESVVYCRNGGVTHPEYQLELELKSLTGSGALAALAAAVAGLKGLAPMAESKPQRGLRLTEHF
ncbi:MAG: CYTH domain-containing protein [Oscillospiraceae bacterium]